MFKIFHIANVAHIISCRVQLRFYKYKICYFVCMTIYRDYQIVLIVVAIVVNVAI